MKKYIVISYVFFLLIANTPMMSHATLFVCQNAHCNYADETFSLTPWMRQLQSFFKNPNARLDFCEADPQKRSCISNSLRWQARSQIIEVSFELPVARALPHQKTLLVDYLIRANESVPDCGFSNTTFELTDRGTIRLASSAFSCDITGLGPTQLQNTFFVDYIDFDNAVMGAHYTIQTHGELQGIVSGYTLVKFRDGNSLTPLLAQPEYGPIPDAPNAAQSAQIQQQLQDIHTRPEDQENPLMRGLSDWWQELKNSFNTDKPKTTSPYQEKSFWNRFTDTLSKVIYLEPLD